MSETPLRVAVIGCGFYAQNHLNAWSDLSGEGAQLVAVCDIDAGKAEAAGESFAVPWYTDIQEMITTSKPAVLDIVTRMDTHKDLVTIAIKNSIGAMIQKPLAPTWDDCCEIANIVSEAGIFFGVHENFRFQAPIQRVRQLIKNDVVGKINSARFSFKTGFDVFNTQPYLRDERRLVILDVGIHILDLARVLIGEVKHLTCETQQRSEHIKGEDFASMMLRHEGGAISQLEVSFASKCSPDVFPETLIEIEGEDGLIKLEPGGNISVLSRGLNWSENTATTLLNWTERPWHVTQESVLLLNRHVLNRYNSGTLPETTIQDNLKTYALMEAAYLAADKAEVVTPKRWRKQ